MRYYPLDLGVLHGMNGGQRASDKAVIVRSTRHNMNRWAHLEASG